MPAMAIQTDLIHLRNGDGRPACGLDHGLTVTEQEFLPLVAQPDTDVCTGCEEVVYDPARAKMSLNA
jgi:hypothetical protein